MEDVTIESLVAQGNIVTTTDLNNPANDYMIVGVYQKGTNPMKGNGTSYKNYVISIAELLGGGSAYTASNGVVLIGNDFQLASNNISQFTNDSGYLTAATIKASAWVPDGNGFASEKFLGTLNNFALPFRVNNNEVARFTTDPAGSTRLYINANTNLYGSNAGIQYNSDGTSPNRAQLRLNTHGNNIGAPGITGFKSRGLTIGSTLSVLPGDNLFRITSIGVSGNDTSMNLASLIDVRVNQVFPGYVSTDFVVALNSNAGVMTERLYVTSEGNVGIGTSVPAARVHIVGSGNTTATIGVQSVSANTQNWFRAYDDGTIWSQGAANNAHLFASYVGNVSATYDSPGIQFLEFKIAGVIKSQLINQAALTRFNQAAGQFWGVYGSDNNPYILFDETNKNVGIGTSTPVQKLDVVGNINVGLTDGYYLNNLKFLSGNGFNSDSIQLGRGANGTAAAGDQYIAMGIFSYATESGIAIGYSSTINNGTFDGIAIGRAAVVDAGLIRGVALGRNANAKHNNAWAIGFNAVTTQDNEFNFGVVGTESKLIVNGSVGVSVANPTARLQVRGIDATAFNTAFRVEDSAGNRIMAARNDGLTFFGPRYCALSSSNIVSGGEFNMIAEQLFLLDSLVPTVDIEAYNKIIRFKMWHGGAANNSVEFVGRGAAGFESFMRTNDITTLDTGFKTYVGSSAAVGDTNFRHCFVTGNVHIGYDEVVNSNTTKLTIRGRNALSTHNNLLLQDNVSTTLLKVTNNGQISAPLIQTGNAGLVAGDLYVDTAANILANGDQVVGRKV